MIHQTELEAKLQSPYRIGGNYLIFSDSRDETPKISDRVKGRRIARLPRAAYRRPTFSRLVNITACGVFLGAILVFVWFA